MVPREQALNHISELLSDHIHVPITTHPAGQSHLHAVVLMDVRGEEGHRIFLVNDPAPGVGTFRVSEAALQAQSSTDAGWNPQFGGWVNYMDSAELHRQP